MVMDPRGGEVIAVQWTLLLVAFGVIIARLYLRLILQRRRLLASDYFMCAGWCTAAASACFDIVFYQDGAMRQGVTLGLVGFEGTAEEASEFYKVSKQRLIYSLGSGLTIYTSSTTFLIIPFIQHSTYQKQLYCLYISKYFPTSW
ncbi:hypothetical protein FVEN_g13020 [Fusarium venenatum]|nr:hypothetical protein FVEN_g13020 [Fusarium venenatum]